MKKMAALAVALFLCICPALAWQIHKGAVLPFLTFTVQPAQGACALLLDYTEITSSDGAFAGSVSVALDDNPGGATLAGTTTQTATAGVAFFDDLYLDLDDAAATLIATATGNTSAISAPFTVANGAATACLTAPNPYLQGFHNNSPTNVPADSPYGLLMFWAGGNGSSRSNIILLGGHGSTNTLRVQGDNSTFTLRLLDSGNATIVDASIAALSLGGWHQWLIGWDTSTNTMKWIVDGVDVTGSVTVTWNSTNAVNYSAISYVDLNTNRLADLSDLYLWVPGSYVDPSTALASVRSGGSPVSIGDGSAVTGTPAWIGLHGTAANYLADLGSGGIFTAETAPVFAATTTPW